MFVGSLKENEKTREIPIIFLTAKTEESDISAAFEAGGVDYITKPIKIKEVLVRIKTHLNLKEARETQQKQNEELKKIVANRDKFFSIIAHDLKSPFQSFIGLTEVMAEQINNFSKAELIVSSKELNTCANNFFKLLTNLLEWARMQQGVLVFNPVEINLSEAVIRNINLIIKRGEQKGIEIITEVPENQKVYADQDMFNSILSNLLSNALKFTNRGER